MPLLSEQLTSLERLALEDWVARRDQIRRNWFVVGTFGWGGMFAFLFGLWLYQSGQLTSFKDVAILVGLSLVGGFVWGGFMWFALNRWRRRMQARADAADT